MTNDLLHIAAFPYNRLPVLAEFSLTPRKVRAPDLRLTAPKELLEKAPRSEGRRDLYVDSLTIPHAVLPAEGSGHAVASAQDLIIDIRFGVHKFPSAQDGLAAIVDIGNAPPDSTWDMGFGYGDGSFGFPSRGRRCKIPVRCISLEKSEWVYGGERGASVECYMVRFESAGAYLFVSAVVDIGI